MSECELPVQYNGWEKNISFEWVSSECQAGGRWVHGMTEIIAGILCPDLVGSHEEKPGEKKKNGSERNKGMILSLWKRNCNNPWFKKINLFNLSKSGLIGELIPVFNIYLKYLFHNSEYITKRIHSILWLEAGAKQIQTLKKNPVF